jgi:glycerol kinase
MSQILAIDEGTTGVTCLMVSPDGVITGRGYREITQYFPRPGWVEHDPEELFTATVDAGREAIAAAAEMPAAIGITNQRETVVVWDRETSRAVYRAIVWQDRRTSDACTRLARHGDLVRERTGLVIDPYFSATKLRWLIEEGGVLETRAVGSLAAGTVDSWLIWRLTGGMVHATDPTNASRTLLYDIDRRSWSDELCTLFEVPREWLPEVRASAGDFGVADEEWFGARIPIRGVAGDQQAALFGQGCWERGSSKNTYGTGAFVLLNAGDTRPGSAPGVLTTIACGARGEAVFALEGAIFIAGAAIQWLRDGLGIIDSAAEAESMARSVDSTGGVYFVPALVGLGAPAWEPRARGTIVGLTRGTTAAHLTRAALEAMAFSTREVLDLMSQCAGAPFDRLRVDGGAAANDWLMQFQADVLGAPVERPRVVESTALGAAGLAGIAAGVWPDASTFLGSRQFDVFAPSAGTKDVDGALHEWRRAVRAALHWATDRA